MSEESIETVKEYYNQVASEYDRHYAEDIDGYPNNRIRREIVVDRLVEAEVDTVLDVGCGDGSVMLSLLEEGLDVVGFDFAENMVSEAKGKLEANDFDPDRVSHGDIREELPRDEDFDAVIALGVFPHLPNTEGNLEGIRETLADGGVTLIEFRNDLFDVFTLNKYSYEFYANELLAEVDLPTEAATALDQRLRDAFNVTPAETEAQGDQDDELSYDDIYAPFSNPFIVEEQFESLGYTDLDMHFYHYHGMLPEFEAEYPEAFHEASLEFEDPNDWRGYLMASAFVIEGWNGTTESA